MNLASSSEWSGSEIVRDPTSPNTASASSKVTWCLRRFDSAFLSDHSNWMDQTSDESRLT
jgi:hypothetical protein